MTDTVNPTPAQVRDWARCQGLTVGIRGPIKPAIMQAYREAHPQDTP